MPGREAFAAIRCGDQVVDARRLALAWEQIAYCDEMLDDRTLFHRERGRPEMLLDDLASALTRSSVWWLWWD